MLLAEEAGIVSCGCGPFMMYIGRRVLATVGRRMIGHIAVQLPDGPRRLGRGLQVLTFAASGAPLISSCRVVGVHFGILRGQVGVADPHIVDGFEVVTGRQASRSFRIICNLSKEVGIVLLAAHSCRRLSFLLPVALQEVVPEKNTRAMADRMLGSLVHHVLRARLNLTIPMLEPHSGSALVPVDLEPARMIVDRVHILAQ